MSPQLSHNNGTATLVSGIPMTAEALSNLEAEIERLTASLAEARTAAPDACAGDDPEAPTASAAEALHLMTQRLEALRGVLVAARVVEPDGAAVVGSRVTVRDPDGCADTYVLVAPGTGDLRAGRLSPDAPLGAALLGRRAGEAVDVVAPAGTWRATIVNID